MDIETVTIEPAPRLAADCAGAGPLVVFLHGIGGNRTNWHDQLRAFAPRYRAVAWDARGYGRSDDYDGPLAFDDFVADLKRLIDHFGAARAHLVGLSMGGRIAVAFAFAHPARVATLTLADTHTGFGALTPAQREDYVATRLAPLEAGKTVADIAPGLVAKLLGPKATDAVRQRLIASVSALRQESYIKSLRATVEQDSVGDYGRLAPPCHVMVGAHDPLTTPALCRALADEIPGAEYTVIPGAGHLTNIEQPEAFNRVALDFIDRHPGA